MTGRESLIASRERPLQTSLVDGMERTTGPLPPSCDVSILEERLPHLDSLTLGHGSHPAPSNGLVEACVMEAVAYIAGEPWSDHPECASPVLTTFLVSWNDSLPDDDRQMLKPFIPSLVGTRTGAKDEETRAWMLTDWLARECAPAWMRLAGLTAKAELLEALAPIDSAGSARRAQPTLTAARKESAAAGAAAVWDATWVAASWAAAGAAAVAAARAASTPERTRDQARAAAVDAAGAAAVAAAGAALQPTVKGLQASALLLLDRMIEVGRS